MKRKILICSVILFLLVTTLAGCRSAGGNADNEYSVGFVKASDGTDGYATVYVPAGRDAKVLLLADTQLDPTEKYKILGSANELTLIFLEKFLDATAPDLVIIAGDVVMTILLNNWSYFCQIADIFEQKQVPWTFVFGNHDCEKWYVSESSDTESRFAQMSKPAFIAAVQGKYEYCLIYSGECEEGYGNHIVNVRDTHGKLLTTFCNLDCVYNDDEGYSHVITKAQTDFYVNAIETLSKSEGRTVPSIVVTHVPLPQVYTGYNEAKEGKNGSKYFYGEMLETDVKSYKGQSTFFDALVRLGSTKAVFFGHHHSNDLSVEYQGIRLSFIPHSGMSHEYRVKHSKEYKLFWPPETVFDFTDVDVYGDHRGGVMVSAGQEGYSFAPIHAAEVIPDYAEWAINYDEVAQAIVQKRGEKHVVRGK